MASRTRKIEAGAQRSGFRRTTWSVQPAKRVTEAEDRGRITAKKGGGRITAFKAAASYQGEWKRDKKHGYGTLIKADGTKYEGDWADDQRHGRGVLWVRRDGALVRRYAGGWHRGKKHGVGVLFHDNGDRFEGNFVGGKRDGHGIMSFANGDTYEGNWQAGLRGGVGVLTRANGDTYEGNWQDGQQHGAGRYYYMQRGKVYEGEWVEGTAKCGVLSALPRELAAEAAAAAAATAADGAATPGSMPLPVLELVSPDQVVQAAVLEAREAARVARSIRVGEEAVPTTAQAEGGAAAVALSEEELMQLEDAYMVGGPDDDGLVPAEALPEILRALGLDPGPEDTDRLLGMIQPEPRSGGDPSQLYMSFDGFAGVMAKLRE